MALETPVALVALVALVAPLAPVAPVALVRGLVLNYDRRVKNRKISGAGAIFLCKAGAPPKIVLKVFFCGRFFLVEDFFW